MSIEITTADSTVLTGIRNALSAASLSGAEGWDSAYTTTNANSAGWNIAVDVAAEAYIGMVSVTSTVATNSASWGGGGAGGGDVSGPASSTDNAIARYDLTTGKLLQDSLVTVSDTGAITAPGVGSVIPFYYANQAAFPDASTYHGALAHSHNDGRMYFAHGGTWNAMANVTDPVNSNSVVLSTSNVILSACTVTTYLSVGGIIYSSQINTVGTGTPTLSSGSDIRLDAVTRVTVSNTPFRIANFTTASRDAITPLYGDMIYNTTTNKFQGYASVGWVDLN